MPDPDQRVHTASGFLFPPDWGSRDLDPTYPLSMQLGLRGPIVLSDGRIPATTCLFVRSPEFNAVRFFSVMDQTTLVCFDAEVVKRAIAFGLGISVETEPNLMWEYARFQHLTGHYDTGYPVIFLSAL